MKRALTLFFALACLVAANGAEITSPALTLRFDEKDASPVSLRNAAGEELLVPSRNSGGFMIAPDERAEGSRLRFTRLAPAGEGAWQFRTDAGDASLTVQVTHGGEYLAFRITKMEGLAAHAAERLFFELQTADGKVRCVPLDYMTDERGHAARVLAARDALWEQSAANPLGGFAIYAPRDAAQEDEILLDLWTQEKLPHPQVKGEWSKDAARAWLERWAAVNRDTSHLNVIADSLDELRESFAFARRMDARAIYLWPGMWRGEYWLEQRRNDDVNPALFPGGHAELERFAKEARAQGFALKLHYLCGNIGEHDPDFVEPQVSPELASWGTGTLAEPADEKAREFVIRLAPGVRMPEHGADSGAQIIPPALPKIFDFRTLHIGGEWVEAGSVTAQGDGYRLRDCRRGMWGTKAVAHAADEAWRGYLRPYNQDFVPDNNAPLLETIARRWAELNNRVGCPLANFDGYENHAYAGAWGSRKFATLVYQHLDHPVQATSSNGMPPPCFLEYRFNRSRAVLGSFLGDDSGVSLFAADPSRPAPGLEEAEYQLSRAAFWGVRGFDLGSNDVKGVPLPTLRGYGLRDPLLDLIRRWKAVSAALSADERKAMDVFTKPDRQRMALNGFHARADRLWRLEDGQIRAWHALGDRHFTTDWHTGQEHGVITPRCYVRPGEVLELRSEKAPPEDSPLRLVGRVLPAFDPEHAENIALMPLLGESAGNLQGENPSDAPRWITDLPRHSLPRAFDLSRHRGLGLWVTGDGSGANLLIQLHAANMRDYVVPIDFTGRRWIEIPNGEVAWRLGSWGWRSDTEKSFRYDQVRAISIGIGFLPAHSTCRVQVEGLRALREIETALVDPTFTVGGQTVQLRGTIPAGHHFIIAAQGPCATFDPNWNPGPSLPRTGELHGPALIPSFSFQTPSPSVWLEIGLQKSGAAHPFLSKQPANEPR